MLDLAGFQLQRGMPKVLQLVEFIRNEVEQGNLLPGSRLPTLKQFSDELQISRYTVVEALERLKAGGFVTSEQGRGYFTASGTSVDNSEPKPKKELADLHSQLKHAFANRNIAHRPGCGFLPESWIDTDQLRKALRQTLRKPNLRFSEYGDAKGYLPFRKTLQNKLHGLGMSVDEDQLVLCSSTMNAIDLLFRMMLSPGDTIMLEDPCYFNLHNCASIHNVHTVYVPRITGKEQLAQLNMTLEKYRPKAFLMSSLMHNPTGHSYSLQDMFTIVSLLKQYDCHLIEDDLYQDLATTFKKPMTALCGFENATYISGFSKLLSGNLRSAYLATNAENANGLVKLKSRTGGVTSEFTELAINELFVDGAYHRHQRRLVSKLSESSGRVKFFLQSHGFTFPVQNSNGLFLWAKMPRNLDSDQLAQKALSDQIALAPGTLFSNDEGKGFMRFNIAHMDDPVLMEKLAVLF